MSYFHAPITKLIVRAREALRQCLPDALKDNTFTALLKGDHVTKRCLATLLSNLQERE